MNHPHPSDRTHATGVHPSTEFCPGAPGLTPGFSPIMQNKPNSRCPDQILTTNDWRLKTAFNKTNPISSPLLPHAWCLMPHLYETNPICPHGHPALRQKMQNKPNYPTVSPQPMQSRTNSPRCASPRKNWCAETNPITPAGKPAASSRTTTLAAYTVLLNQK